MPVLQAVGQYQALAYVPAQACSASTAVQIEVLLQALQATAAKPQAKVAVYECVSRNLQPFAASSDFSSAEEVKTVIQQVFSRAAAWHTAVHPQCIRGVCTLESPLCLAAW